MAYEFIMLVVLSFLVTYLFTYLLIPRLMRFRIIGKDINKPGMPEVPEMGGLAIVAGFTAGILLAVFLNSFFSFNFNFSTTPRPTAKPEINNEASTWL